MNERSEGLNIMSASIHESVKFAQNADEIAPAEASTQTSSGMDENDDENQIIHSPLDQRSYKSITLANGVRVMLISTFNAESFPDEIDATKTPCQVPEVAEFNKMYLGYDNPAARVKCACPCDERKICCCNAPKDDSNETSEKVCENTLKSVTGMKSACCSNAAPRQPSSLKITTVENAKATKDFRNEIMGMNENMENYRNKIFNELKQRELEIFKARQAKSRIEQTSDTDPDEIVDSSSGLKFSVDHLSQEFTKESVTKHFRNSSLKHYPHPPKYVEGLHKNHCCPIESSRSGPRDNRSRFSDEYSPELEGTVYLVIGSGYFDDPDDQMPGLAHFCEHAVFLGSSKFPEANQLFKLVLPYNGYVNAYTSGMMTTFTVSSSYKLFPLAVEILGDMVGFPLFPNTLVAAELEALDAEYSLRQDDTPRYFQLIGSLAKKGHIMRKMDSGNLSTLTVPNFYRKLVEWRKIYYSPSRMTLAVEAPFPLDFLERLVTESFGKIPQPHAAPVPLMTNRHLLSNGPFDMKRFHQIYHVPSVYHSEFIALHWGLDSKAWKNLKVKPLEYLGAIISHKANGGLFDYLTSQGLATNVDAGCWESDVTRNHYTSVFCISVDMTEKGFKRQDNILQAIFGYIEMLIANRPQKSFFQELQKQQLESFHYRAAEASMNTAEGISRWMQFIPPKWCLISPTLTAEFDENLIQKYTECLTIDTANVIIFSKNYRGVEYTSRSMEEFYKTAYEAFNFPNELKEKIHRTKEEYASNFTLPPPNPLLLNTACSRARESDLLKKGSLTKIKGKLSVSYVSRKVRFVRGLLPQARYSIWIGSPSSSYIGAPEGSSTKMLIWSLFINELLESKFYHASSADIQMETEVSQGELHLIVAGPSTMLPSLVEQVIALFDDFENVVDQIGFEVIRSSFIECLDNTILDNRFLAWDLFYYLWTNNHDLIFDHKRNAERMAFSSFITFVKTFKTKMYIQAHLYGYVTKTQGQSIVNALTKLEYSPIELRQYLLYRCVMLPLGERLIKVHSQNPNVHTSVVINSYQFGMLTDAEEEAVNFFAKTMSDAAFYQLRTEQQLGYIIIIYSEMTYGVSSIIVELVTQPKNFSTEFCNEQIDKFLLSFFMENLSSPESFMEFSLGKPKLDLPFPTIKNLFAAHLLPNPFSYRKLSIQIIGEIQDASSPPVKSPEKPPQAQSIFRKLSQTQHMDADHSKLPDVQVNITRNSIEHVRAAKKSLQLRSSQQEKTGSFSSDTVIPKKVVNHVAKFKQNLKYYPNILSQ